MMWVLGTCVNVSLLLTVWKIADAQQRFANKMNERMEIQVQRKFVLALIKGDFVIFFQCY